MMWLAIPADTAHYYLYSYLAPTYLTTLTTYGLGVVVV